MEDQDIKKEILVKRTYKHKNGEECIKTYDQKKYNDAFYQKHKEVMTMKHSCECGGKYTITNKSRHDKGKYHTLYKSKTI